MSSIAHALSDIVSSFLELIGSIVETIFNIFRGAIDVVVQFVTGLVSMVLELFKGALHTAGGVGQFLASNIVVLLVMGAAVFGFLQYQRSQGRTVQVGDKKLN